MPSMAVRLRRAVGAKDSLSGSWFDGWQSGWWGRSMRKHGPWGSSWGLGTHPGSKVDYAAHVGSGLASSVLMSPVRWVQRTLPEAPIRIRPKDEEDALEDHVLMDRLNKPNKFHTCTDMLKATVYSYIVDGNGYWVKKRAGGRKSGMRWWENVTGEVEELWWVPHWRILPCSPPGGDEFISHYELFMRHSGRIKLPLENVIHFRNGIDPERPQYGMSVIYSELREIYTDDEAAAFTSTILRNVGVPGLVISPRMWPSGDGDDIAIVQDTDAVKRYVEERFGGDNRGRALVLEAPAEVKTLGFNPREMDLGSIRNTVEERVCAAIGVQPAVVGFGTGLQQTKVGATMSESVKLSWINGIIPIQGAFAEVLAMNLLPEYEESPGEFRVYFDRSKIQVLQEDQDAKIKRLDIAVKGGWMRVDHAQAEAGFEVDETQKLYLRPGNMMEVEAETDPFAEPDPPPEPPPAPMPPGMVPPPPEPGGTPRPPQPT